MLCHYKILVRLIGLGLITVVHGYEVLEGRYTGEKYHPAPDTNAHYQYSSAYRSSALSNPSATVNLDQSEGRSSMGIFGSLIRQLSSVLQRKFVNSGRGSGSNIGQMVLEGRSLQKKETKAKAEDGELYYHYYPSNQHMFNLPECATQQVCNAVYIRLNFTQPLCACPALSDPCSASYLSNDQHTIELKMGNSKDNAVTLVKTCEPVWSVRECRQPRDWAILALQNTRTGKAHYLVICKCAASGKLDGPLNHDQPTYAQVPGIRVYGMMCNTENTESRVRRDTKYINKPEFPWWRVKRALDKGIVKNLLDDEDSEVISIDNKQKLPEEERTI